MAIKKYISERVKKMIYFCMSTQYLSKYYLLLL